MSSKPLLGKNRTGIELLYDLLCAARGEIGVTALVDNANMSKDGTERAIALLLKLGLLEQKMDDKRRRKFTTTAKGLGFMRDAERVFAYLKEGET